MKCTPAGSRTRTLVELSQKDSNTPFMFVNDKNTSDKPRVCVLLANDTHELFNGEQLNADCLAMLDLKNHQLVQVIR